MIESFSARTTTVGGIPIARLLPNRNKQPIGAWCFLDHAGPAQLDAHNDGIQVGLHPHINLQTFTWMLSGEILHQDSLGNEQIIRPKQINLMTAGTGNTRGIAHTERSIFESAAAHRLLHAVQLWIALPVHQDIEPGFHHYPELPAWHEQGAQFTLLTGQYAGQRAPTLQYSPLIGMDIVCQQAGELNLTLQPGFEYGIMVLTGTVRSDGQTFSPNELGKLSVQNAPQSLQISVQAGTHLLFIGGEPLPHKTLIWWNFIADNKADLQQAVADWNARAPRFGRLSTDMPTHTAPEVPDGFRE